MWATRDVHLIVVADPSPVLPSSVPGFRGQLRGHHRIIVYNRSGATESLPPPETANTSIAERFKQHPVVSIFLLCSAVAAAAWGVEYQVFVLPRDFTIQSLKGDLEKKESSAQSSEIVLKPTFLSVGDSITTSDGICLIHVEGILLPLVGHELRVQLSVTGGEVKTQYDPKPTGTRLLFVTEDDKSEYFFDVIEIQETKVSVSATRQLITRPTHGKTGDRRG
jgi:hypothetical protein